jgi:hypothetical protein
LPSREQDRRRQLVRQLLIRLASRLKGSLHATVWISGSSACICASA